MTDEAQRWKEKYLKSIEQQEKLERRWEARLDLLRRGLVRSTLAAEGSDRAVDLCMKEMREVIRTDNMDAALAGLIPRLEKAVLDSEQRRATRVVQVTTALNALVSQLQTLPLPSEVSRPLKKFAKQVEARASHSREMPLLLGELSGLQGQALSAMERPEEAQRPGLLQRLFGGREAEAKAMQPALTGTAAVVAEAREQPAPMLHAVVETAAHELADVDELQPLPTARAIGPETIEPARVEADVIEAPQLAPAPEPEPEPVAELPTAPATAAEPAAPVEPDALDSEQDVLALLEHSPDEPLADRPEAEPVEAGASGR